MRPVRRFWSRLRATLSATRRDSDLTAEIESHLQMQADDNERLGMAPDQARRAAAVKFGSVTTARERWHDQRVLPLADTIGRDVRFALRGLAKAPGFTAACVVTLALAIGASTAVFSVVNAVLIRPLPYPDADRLVQVWETNPGANRWGDWASYPDFEDWRREQRVFDGMAAFRQRPLRLTAGPHAEMVNGVRVSADIFSVLRVDAMLGRTFLREEGDAGRADVVVLSYGLWQRQFGSNPRIVGQTIPLDGRSHLIIGVMPPGFDFPASVQSAERPPDVWVPVGSDTARGSHNYRVIARLAPQRNLAEARNDMDRLVRYVADLDPAHRNRGGAVAGLQQHAAQGVRPSLSLLAGAILVVLAIACANVANLLLARGAARQRQVALRLTLGATPARVLQQSLTESLVLAVLGAGAGLLAAFAGLRALIDLAPDLPLVRSSSVDLRVLGFTCLTALVTGVAFGVAPVLQTLETRANDVLKATGGRQTGGVSHTRLRTILTVAEVALALMLLLGGGLLVRSFVQLRSVDAGFDADHLLVAMLGTLDPRPDRDRTVAFFSDVLERLEQTPGITAVAGASTVPLISNESGGFRVSDGPRATDSGDGVFAERPKITPGYFRTMGIGVLRGRGFTAADLGSSEPVAVVSKSFADSYWPGEDAVGRRVSIDDEVWRRVVGVVEDVRHDGLDQPARVTIYIPFAQYPRSLMTLLVRSETDRATLTGLVRRAVTDVDPGQPVFAVQTMDEILRTSFSLRRFLMTVVGLFAAAAVVLSVVGVYGVLAYLAGQRTREIAVRMALGATRPEVVWLVVRQGVWLALVGVGLGLLGSVALSRLLSGLLFGVSTLDTWTYTVAPMLLILVVLAASLVPGLTAARVQPAVALRGD